MVNALVRQDSAALGIGLVFSVVLSNRLVRPLRAMQDVTTRISRGDYDVEVATHSQAIPHDGS